MSINYMTSISNAKVDVGISDVRVVSGPKVPRKRGLSVLIRFLGING